MSQTRPLTPTGVPGERSERIHVCRRMVIAGAVPAIIPVVAVVEWERGRTANDVLPLVIAEPGESFRALAERLAPWIVREATDRSQVLIFDRVEMDLSDVSHESNDDADAQVVLMGELVSVDLERVPMWIFLRPLYAV